jgi:hypothetical protein
MAPSPSQHDGSRMELGKGLTATQIMRMHAYVKNILHKPVVSNHVHGHSVSSWSGAN